MFNLKQHIGALAVIVFVGLTLAGCGGESSGDLFKQAANNMKAAKSFYVEANGTQGGTDINLKGDVNVAEQESKITVTSSGQTADLIISGNHAYVSTDGGQSYAESDSASAAVSFGLFTGLWKDLKPGEVEQSKDGFKDGSPATEQIDGTATRHLTGSGKSLTTLGGFGSGDYTLDVWITTEANPTVRQMKIAGTDGNLTVKWSKINQPIEIAVPTPDIFGN